MLSLDVEEGLDNTLEQEGNINCINMQKEVALVNCNHREEKVMTNCFCIKIHMKHNIWYCLFDSSS
jgi:hypothetical protein